MASDFEKVVWQDGNLTGLQKRFVTENTNDGQRQNELVLNERKDKSVHQRKEKVVGEEMSQDGSKRRIKIERNVMKGRSSLLKLRKHFTRP